MFLSGSFYHAKQYKYLAIFKAKLMFDPSIKTAVQYFGAILVKMEAVIHKNVTFSKLVVNKFIKKIRRFRCHNIYKADKPEYLVC